MGPGGQNEIDEKLEQAKRILLPIPGVLSVAWGYKEKAGQATQQLSFIVMVREKKPPENLSPEETVPREVLGIPTDVIRMPRLKKLACENIDKFDPLVGGSMISTLKVYQANHNLQNESVGTLGFFATNSSGARDNVVLLSNNHVLAENGAAVGDVVFQPRFTGSSDLGYHLDASDMHPIGSIENLGMQDNRNYAYSGESANSMFVDCATAHVNTSFSSCCHTNCGTKFANILHNLNQCPDFTSSEVAGVARVTNADLPASGSYPVYKVGHRTGWTKGKIRTTAANIVDPDNPSIHHDRVIIIDELGPNCGGGTVFAGEGDSGSVIVNAQRQIIGLLFADTDLGFYVACHIHPVIDLLGITMVSAQNTAGASGGATSLETALALDESDRDVERAMVLREEVLRSSRGLQYRALVEKHIQEVVHLVNHVRPVTVAWHRLHGPDFLGHILHASRHAAYPVPRELHGLRRDEALGRILETLHKHGSTQLRGDIERNAEEVRALFDNIDDLDSLAALVQPPQVSVR
ncbi:MAG TPA: hypothetical protein VLT16_00465 [Candidatus Limnocylindrales bacterium]|nr:hypothetical protein [Candidatus Limnocylindrales bacterium]